MKIGIDARMYRSSVAGIGRYSQNLIKNLLEIDREDEFVLFMTPEDKKEFENFNIENSFKIENLKFKIVIVDIPHFSLTEQTKFGKIIKNENLDIMHFLNFNFPVRYKGKFIVTIHDLTLILFPDTAKNNNFIKNSAFHFVLNHATKNAQKIITDSENTKKDIINKLKIQSSKIKTIHLAADDKMFDDINKSHIDSLKKQYSIDNKPVILYVGQFRPHKNLPSLIEAFDLLKNEFDCRLVFLGKPDPKHQRFYKTLDISANKRDIIMPGFVSNEELATWYKIATVFCFPSLYEGFGLPGLEAMTAGTAVVASNSSSLPEIYGKAAIYFNPLKTEEIAAKIKEVIANPALRADLIRKGKIQVRKYSWEKTALQTLKVYREIQKSKSRPLL